MIDQTAAFDGHVTSIEVHAPLKTIRTCQRDLESQTAGEGSFTMTLFDDSTVPVQQQKQFLAVIGTKHEVQE